MPYIIDGHNLIPNIPSLRLDAVDDEIELIQRLQRFQRKCRKKIEVYFDNAAPGESRTQRYGSVTAHFIHPNSTADAAIIRKLEELGGAARTWTVVSSDREVVKAAQVAQARHIRSEDFVDQLISTEENYGGNFNADESKFDLSLSPDEVEEWLQLFRGNENDD